jgi:hypothetical protein
MQHAFAKATACARTPSQARERLTLRLLLTLVRRCLRTVGAAGGGVTHGDENPASGTATARREKG